MIIHYVTHAGICRSRNTSEKKPNQNSYDMRQTINSKQNKQQNNNNNNKLYNALEDDGEKVKVALSKGTPES